MTAIDILWNAIVANWSLLAGFGASVVALCACCLLIDGDDF